MPTSWSSPPSDRERIIESAREKFFSHGPSSVTVDEIATDLGMSKKTIYKFFPSKEEMVRAVVRFTMARAANKVGAIVSADELFDKKLLRLMTFLGQLLGQTSRRFPMEMKRSYPDLWHEIERFRREHILEALKSMFVQGKEEGYFREDVNVDIFILMFTQSVEGIVNPATLSEHSFSTTDAISNIFSILFAGALTDDARATFHLHHDSQPKNKR